MQALNLSQTACLISGRYFAQSESRELRVETETETETESTCEPNNKTNSHTQTKISNIRSNKTNSHEYAIAEINHAINQETTLPRGGGQRG